MELFVKPCLFCISLSPTVLCVNDNIVIDGGVGGSVRQDLKRERGQHKQPPLLSSFSNPKRHRTTNRGAVITHKHARAHTHTHTHTHTQCYQWTPLDSWLNWLVLNSTLPPPLPIPLLLTFSLNLFFLFFSYFSLTVGCEE